MGFFAETAVARIDRDLRRTTLMHRKSLCCTLGGSYLIKDGAQIKKMLEKEHNCRFTIVEDEQLDQDEYNFTPVYNAIS